MATQKSNLFLRFTRMIHLYLGAFTAPALIFFAFTGALQTFSLHETTAGSSYKPPAWAVILGQIHKKQTPVVSPKKMAAPEKAKKAKLPDAPVPEKVSMETASPDKAGAPPAPPETMTKRAHHPLPLKIFFLIVSIGLFLSTLSGIYMSYKYIRNKVLVTALLVLGLVIPVLFVFV